MCAGSAYGQPPRDDTLPGTVLSGLGTRVDEYLSRAARFGVAGAIVVVQDDVTVLAKGYGLADRPAGAAIGPNSPFAIGSLSKQFTAAAILTLVARHTLSLADSLSRFFPGAPPDKRPITVRQLLTHTSGLPYLPSGDFFADAGRAQVMREVLALPLESAPGSRYAYSSPGYTLLAGIIERVSGESFEVYLRDALFRPAALTRTTFLGVTPAPETLTSVHSYSDAADEGPLAGLPACARGVGAGTIVSTAGDMARWMRALDGDVVLPASLRRELTAPAVAVDSQTSYAYGWNVTRTPRGATIIGHAGDLGGYNAELRQYVEPRVTVVFLSNTRVDGAGDRTAVMTVVGHLLAGDSVALPPLPVPLDQASVASWAGTYDSPGGTLRVAARGDDLTIVADGAPMLAALADEDSSARLRGDSLSALAAPIFAGIHRGDLTVLEAHLHRAVPIAAIRAGIAAEWHTLRGSVGSPDTTELLGTAVLSPVASRTYARIRGPRGVRIVSIRWRQGRITAVERENEAPLAVAAVPTGPARFASFDPFTSRSLEITFDRGADGRAQVWLHGASANVRATRRDPAPGAPS